MRRVVREERNFTPALQLDKMPSLQWRIYCAILDQRYEDISDIDDAVIAEQHHLQQQWDLAIQEGRGYAADRFSDAIHRNLDDYMRRVVREERNFTPALQLDNMPSLQEQFDRALLEQRFEDLPGLQEAMRAEHGGVQPQLALAINEERCLDAAHFCDAIARSVEEQMDIAVSDTTCRGESPGFRLPHGPILVLAADSIRAAPKMLGAAAAPAAAKQDNVGNEVHDNMCKGDISGHDYDMGDGMSTEADKLKALFADEDAMGGHTNGQSVF
jgi:hypothetical protein